MRLIDADLLEKEIYKWMPKDQETWMQADLPPIENLVVSIMMTIQEQPTVDAVPVRHGKWMLYYDIEQGRALRCSECKMVFWVGNGREGNFCPNCGADMRGKKNEIYYQSLR